MVALGLHFCTWPFCGLSLVSGSYSLVVVHELLIVAASFVAGHGF